MLRRVRAEAERPFSRNILKKNQISSQIGVCLTNYIYNQTPQRVQDLMFSDIHAFTILAQGGSTPVPLYFGERD